jgi:hypothetical protein
MDDREGDGWPDLNLKNLLESLSLFTAASFVLSGFINAAIFWLNWRLNYFAVAQPSDIVMSGFYYVSMAVIVGAAVISTYQLMSLVRGWLSTKATYREIATKRVKKLVILTGISLAAPALVIGAGATIDKLLFSQSASERNVLKDGTITHGASGSWNPDWSLVLTYKSELFERCGAEPLLWIGSSTAVLRCRKEIMVTQLDQVLPVEQVRP